MKHKVKLMEAFKLNHKKNNLNRNTHVVLRNADPIFIGAKSDRCLNSWDKLRLRSQDYQKGKMGRVCFKEITRPISPLILPDFIPSKLWNPIWESTYGPKLAIPQYPNFPFHSNLFSKKSPKLKRRMNNMQKQKNTSKLIYSEKSH